MGNGIQKKIILKCMNKILLYFSLILLIASVNLYANEGNGYFYVPESKLCSLKKLAMNGDKNAAYKLARYYDFYFKDSDSAYKASLWYYISGLLGQKNGHWKAFETLNEVSPIKSTERGQPVTFSDFLKFYPKEKFNIEGNCPRLSNLLTFLYCSKYSRNDRNYEISKKYLLDNKIDLELFLDGNYKKYIYDDFYISPDEIHAMEKLALRGNRRATLELSNYAISYPSSYRKYGFLWDYVYNVILNDGREDISSSFPLLVREKYGIVKTNDIFLTLAHNMLVNHNESMLSNYILYKYYDIIGNNVMMKKYKKILELEKVDNRLLMRHKYNN